MNSAASIRFFRLRCAAALAAVLVSACGGGGGSSPASPSAPVIGQATPGDRSLTVSFSPPTSDGGAAVSQYIVSCRGGILDTVTASGASSPIAVGGLVNGREYSCSVTARNSVGEGPASAAVTATPYTVPLAPTAGAATPGDASIELSFSPPSDDGGSRIIDYELGCTGGGETRSASGTTSPLRLSGLRNGTSYACAVSARNAAGKGQSSVAINVTPRTVPSGAVISSVAPDIQALIVSFVAPSDDGGAPISSYTASCKSGSIVRTSTGSASPLIVRSLTNGVTYSCTVRGSNSAGDGVESAAVDMAPRNLAREAQLEAKIGQVAGRVTITWRDVFFSGTTYRIDSVPIGGAAFVARASIPSVGGNGNTMAWTLDITESTIFRVIAVRPGFTDVAIATASGEVTTAVAFSTSAPSIAFDGGEPLSGTVRLFIGNRIAYPQVEWFVDLNSIGTSPGTPGNPIDWLSTRVANGDHLVSARVQVATNTFLEVKRSVRVGNINLQVPSQTFASGTYNIVAQASSTSGMSTVEAIFAGTSLGILTAPNCATCPSSADTYRWPIDTSKISPGIYAVAVTATDRSGNRRTVEGSVTIQKPLAPPTLNLFTPQLYEIVQGKLTVKGSVSVEEGSPRTVATLGKPLDSGVKIFESTSTTIDASVDLAGFPAGIYLLTVTTSGAGGETRVRREIVVTERPELVYAAVSTLAEDAHLVSSDGRSLLYLEGDGTYWVQSLATGLRVKLQGADTIQRSTDWQVLNGLAYAQGADSDCPTTCVYEWDNSGARRNLSSSSPFASISGTRCQDQDPTVRGNFVMWANWLCGSGVYTIFNRVSGEYQRINPPAGTNYIGNNQFDILADGSAAFIWAQTGGSGTSSTFDVYRAAGGASTRLSTPGLRNVYPRARGSRVVWEQSPIGGNADGTVELMGASTSGGGGRSLAINVLRWALTDQILVWAEATGKNAMGDVNARVLRVERAGNISTVATEPTSSLLGATNGHAVFTEAGRFYRWDSSQGTRTLLLETAPQQVFANDGVIIFTFGAGRVYRLALP